MTADVREVITKPVDTTYASHVSFYLLFGEYISYIVCVLYGCIKCTVFHSIGGLTCDRIIDDTRGIQLSYMNDDSNGWIQIVYFSDTLLYAVSTRHIM